ncbi:UNVERIFIED_ORG: hypothetical protein ABIC97_002356 [Peribacillus simplex]
MIQRSRLLSLVDIITRRTKVQFRISGLLSCAFLIRRNIYIGIGHVGMAQGPKRGE